MNTRQRDEGLYSFRHEHDACGVGVVADLKKPASHGIIEAGITVLKRLTHRGAAGADPETGDGAGILVSIPDEFFRGEIAALPPAGEYGVGMIFLNAAEHAELRAENGEWKAKIEGAFADEGLAAFAWRKVPVVPDAIGKSARECMPDVWQVFVKLANPEAAPQFKEQFERHDYLDRRMFVARRVIEKTLAGVYVCSSSCRSVVYKGLMLAAQIEKFYPDLADPRFKSRLCIVHQRYSTNTFPTWNLAHPFRYLAHNGEINTIKGNINHIASREPLMKSPLFGESLKKVFPLIAQGQSDSASLDNIFELLTLSGRDMMHSMLMLMPQAWGEKYVMGHDARGFCEYHSALMEPWDGPAAVAFSDGVNIGAALDRNGLRPARWTLMKDGFFVLASETGVLDLAPAEIERHGRLRPGAVIYLDLEHSRILENAEVKAYFARRRPYRRWVEENRILINGLFKEIVPSRTRPNAEARRLAFGYTMEDRDDILRVMAATGHEPVGSMGNDAPLAVLSERPQLFFNYFKQLFAQVTNPPIDSIREESVMSLMTYIGNIGNILDETPEHARLVKLRRPVLTDDELSRLGTVADRGFRTARLDMAFPRGGDGAALRSALDALAENAVAAARGGVKILVLSDSDLAPALAPIPSLLATAAVNRALVKAGLRPSVGVIVRTCEAREVMHVALLVSFGATAVNPCLALETVAELNPADPVTAASRYIDALGKGLLKVMSKMGISTIRSFRGAHTFEAVGLGREIVDEWFAGVESPVGGIGLNEVAREVNTRLDAADKAASDTAATGLLPSGGLYRYRSDGEEHLWNPTTLPAFRQAAFRGDAKAYETFANYVNNQRGRHATLRSLFRFRHDRTPVPLEEVESAESIIRRFVSGAMSLGSLSQEVHETLAQAMNALGTMSNSGEGGENYERFGTDKNCGIKQVASGRFGVTIDYLRAAKDIQIKLAQGAKPGEGGQLPGHKVTEFVAKLRNAMPGVTLISPPPHHDIYSIEDLAELIYDLRAANRNARISVKLVSEAGVGTIAAGVAKAHADVVLISGFDGGTGAAPLSSKFHAGLPWELGLAEAQQTLVKNGLRSRVRLQVDGQIKTGRDVVIGALLGAEEFGFGSAALVALGCIQCHNCHANVCPTGIATQDPEKRKCFLGRKEYVANYLRFVAEETRRLLAELGFRSITEACGHSEVLEMDRADTLFKARDLDPSPLFHRVEGDTLHFDPGAPKAGFATYDETAFAGVVDQLAQSADGTGAGDALSGAITLEREISNKDRAVGAELSGEIASRFGAGGLAEGRLKVNFSGVAGQSFGAFLARGVEFVLRGEANDYIGKSLSGGVIVVRRPEGAGFEAERSVIAGNVTAYGATAGKIFLNGQAGERFGIRNSGAILVAEGVGDHGCEYMTGGRAVIIGRTGVNFAAGMTGGIAYVLDEDGCFDTNCNLADVDLESVERGSADEAELKAILAEHVERTASAKAAALLAGWESARPQFVKVFPVEYKNALAKLRK